MSITVQCPNPACAKVHKVKNRYAGHRAPCPDCQTMLYVPRLASPVTANSLASAPSHAGAAVANDEEVIEAVLDETEVVDMVVDEGDVSPPKAKKKGVFGALSGLVRPFGGRRKK